MVNLRREHGVPEHDLRKGNLRKGNLRKGHRHLPNRHRRRVAFWSTWMIAKTKQKKGNIRILRKGTILRKRNL